MLINTISKLKIVNTNHFAMIDFDAHANERILISMLILQ